LAIVSQAKKVIPNLLAAGQQAGNLLIFFMLQLALSGEPFGF